MLGFSLSAAALAVRPPSGAAPGVPANVLTLDGEALTLDLDFITLEEA